MSCPTCTNAINTKEIKVLYSLYRGARSERNFIHVNLAIAIACVQIVFLAGIEETENEVTTNNLSAHVGKLGIFHFRKRVTRECLSSRFCAL